MLTTPVYTYPVVFSCKCEEPFNSFICFQGEIEARTDAEAKEQAMRLFNAPPNTAEGRAFANVLKLYNVPVKHLQWQDWRGPWKEPFEESHKGAENFKSFQYLSRASHVYRSERLPLYVGILLAVSILPKGASDSNEKRGHS